jgi:hypothetical protein
MSAVMLSKVDVAVPRTADVADEVEPKPVEDAPAVPAMVCRLGATIVRSPLTDPTFHCHPVFRAAAFHITRPRGGQ